MAKKYQSSLGEQKIFQSSTFVQHEDIKKNITVLPELESLIPPLGAEEKKQLEINILNEGCREALLVWPTLENVVIPNSASLRPVYVLIDGHNRFNICVKHSLDFQIHLISYSTLEDVKGFMIDNQLGRRNLSTEQASYLRGMKYLNLRKSKGKYERSNHKAQNELYDILPSEHKDQNDPYASSEKKMTTAEQLAQEFKVGQATIKRDAEFAEGLEKLSPQLKLSILAGTTKINKSQIQQLTKTENIEKPLDSLEEIELTLMSTKTQRITQTNAVTPADVLINEIGTLVPKLKNPQRRKDACDKLIKLVSDLQSLL